MSRDDGEPGVEDASRLIEFVRERDVPCPGCGYNLHGLSKTVCPECRRELRLTIGLVDQRIGWLFVTLAPCVFSGISAFILGLPMLIVPLVARNAGPPPPAVYALDAFGWLSAIFGLVLWLRRRSYLRARAAVQILWAIGVWLVHLAAFAVLVAAVL